MPLHSPPMPHTKTVRRAQVHVDTPVTVSLGKEAADAVSYAREYLLSLPQLIKEVEEAAEDLLRSAG